MRRRSGLDDGVCPEDGSAPDPGNKSDGYKRALRRWVSFLIHEPDALLAGSVLFLLVALPLVSLGPAWVALHYYAHTRDVGVKRSWRDAYRFAFIRCGAKAWLMGASDALAIFMAGGCLLGVLGAPGVVGVGADTAGIAAAFAVGAGVVGAAEAAFMLPLPMRILYALLFSVDVLYIMSGIYRYPALRSEPDTGFARLASRGFLLALGNPGWTLMFLFASLLTFILCALTGVGVILLFPAASSALAICAYDEMTVYYLPVQEQTSHDDI